MTLILPTEENGLIRPEWERRPTVKEVYQLMQIIAVRYELDDWRDGCKLLGVNRRTYTRWKQNVDNEPKNKSTITYRPYVLLRSMADGQSFLPVFANCWHLIPEKYITNAANYEMPPMFVFTSIIGNNKPLGVSQNRLSKYFNMSTENLPNRFGAKVKAENFTFSDWALVLLICGVPLDKIFYL